MMEFQHVYVTYSNNIALEDVTFSLEKPCFLTVVGPNGAGKTTLLKTALGLIKPSSGSVSVLGINVSKEPKKVRRLVGYVPQMERIDFSLPFRVRDVVLMGRVVKVGIGRRFSAEDLRKARESLEVVGLEDLWDEPIAHLSGGQRQRVLMARALAADPQILMLDEPLVGIDPASKKTILEVLEKLSREGVGIVIVTHDLNPVMRITDYVLLLNKRVLALGKPDAVVSRESMSDLFGGEVEIVRMGEICYIIGGDVHGGSGARG